MAAVGTRRIGEHALGRELGRGGMGVVYEGHHPRFGPVALKVMLDPAGDPEAVARLRREAGALMRIAHPGVVPVHEVGVHEGRPFIAMALVPGESLHDRLRRGPLEPTRAAAITRALADALGHLHAQGIVHRDLKPHNVILTLGTEAPVLVDFGLARASFDRQRLTATGVALGTPSYMPPEQALGLPATTAADVYALGATLYEMLCGRPPFAGPNALSILASVAEGTPPPRPSEVHPGVDPALERLCLRLMDRDPARRPLPDEVLADLAGWTAPRRRRRGARRFPLLAGVAFALVGLALALIVGAAPRQEPTSADATTPSALATPTASPRVEDAPRATEPRPAAPEATAPSAERRALALLRTSIPKVVRGSAVAADALAEADEACRLAPDSPRVRLTCAWLARMAARAGAADPAEALLEKATAHAEAAAAAGAPAAQVAAMRERIAVDRDDLLAYERACAAAASPEGWFDVGRRARALNRHDDSIPVFAQLAQEPGFDVVAPFNLAGSLSIAGRHAEAAELYRTLLAAVEGLDPASRGQLDRYLAWCRLRLCDLGLMTRDTEAVLANAAEALRLPRELFTPADVVIVLNHQAQALLMADRVADALGPASEAVARCEAEGLRDAALLAQPTAALACGLAASGRLDEARAAMARAFDLAEETTLDQFWVRSKVHELALETFPGDREVVARAEAVFP